MEKINTMSSDYKRQIVSSEKSKRKAWLVLGLTLVIIVVVGGLVVVVMRRRFVMKHKEVEELSILLSESRWHNKELQTKVESLYGSRLDTLNMLCNEYFEKSGSEKVRQTLFNDVEKHILTLRDAKNVAELESIVNTYVDNILVKAAEQLPDLNRKDMIFLTYLYAGFSPKAICIFTDIKIKNFYNRRTRLKERILASEAPDKEYFVSKM